MTNKERSAAIRAELKKLGYNSRQVSVRSGDCGYSDYTDITIKDLAINKADIINVAKQFESIRYDEYSGEILQGCNTFIHVEYDYDVKMEAEKKVMPKIENIIKSLSEKQVNIKKDSKEYVIFKDDRGFYLCVYENETFGRTRINAHSEDSFKWQLANYFVTEMKVFA